MHLGGNKDVHFSHFYASCRLGLIRLKKCTKFINASLNDDVRLHRLYTMYISLLTKQPCIFTYLILDHRAILT